MNVSLTPKLEALVKGKVSSGLYNSVSEVVREALRLLEERDQVQAMKLKALSKDIHEGLESLGRGEGRPLDIEAVKQQGRERLNSQK